MTKLTKQIKTEILELVKTKSHFDIGKQYGISQTAISKYLREINIKSSKGRVNMSKLKVDVDFFKNIDSPEKAYWLGYICADGSINQTGAKVSLISKDKEVIERFVAAISSEHKIRTNNVYDKRTNKTYVSYSVQITNELFTQNLITVGVDSNKTNCLVFPNINKNFYHYFIAGLFDGDGSLSIGFQGKVRVSLISTFEILTFIQNLLFTSNTKLFRVTINKSNVWKMYLYKDALGFLNYIYQDANFKYLTRKYEKYKTLSLP